MIDQSRLNESLAYASVFLLGVVLIVGVILVALFAWQQELDQRADRA